MSPETMPDQVEVTRRDAISFLENAMRNWSTVVFTNDELEDMREALQRFAARHRQAAIQKARADALEEAAKVAESFELAGIGIESVEDHFQAQLDDVATAIRSLTEQEVSRG